MIRLREPGTGRLDSGDFKLLNYQHHHFHHVLHLSQSPKKPQSLLSGAQLKDVKLSFFYSVLVLAVSASNVILKRTRLAEKRKWPGFTDSEEGAQSPPGMWVTEEHKRKREHLSLIHI